MPDADLETVWRAYAFAARCHKGQKRVSGEPYLSHPLEVAYILARMKLGHQSVAAGLLHDTIEDTHATPEEIKESFGEQVWNLVDGVTKISMIEFSTQAERQAENVRKMILAMSKDIRVILIKLADRVHNMRTLDSLPPAKQRRIAQETLDIYAPLANRLGMGWIKTELENSAFKYLWPREYSDIKHKVEKVEAEREKYIEKMVSEVSERLRAEGLAAEVVGRPKHYYSIFSKMRRQDISFDEVFDLMGVRIITGSDQECYRALGVLHSVYKPIPGKLKDYIALPKENMYQSLHTTIVGPEGKPVEFQIRTRRMHQIAEEGIAAHWRYKEGAREGESDDQILWLRRLLEWQQEVKHPREFLEKVKIDLFPDEVYVFTPRQEVKALPRGATPIDFAYTIHTDLGHHLIGAKVNGKLVSLRQELKNGDIIEVLTSKQARPSRDWLKYVKTSKARTKITSYIRQAEKQRAGALGREMLEKEISRLGLDPSEIMQEQKLLSRAQAAGYMSLDSMFIALGLGKLKVSQIISKIAPKAAQEEKKGAMRAFLKKLGARPSRPAPPSAGVRIQDMDDLLIHFAKCCNPVPGDEIRGFISRGRGLVVHTADCPNALNLGLDSERSVDVEWDVKAEGKHTAMIMVETEDRPGMLAQVSAAIAENGSNISEATIRVGGRQGRGYIYITVEITDLAHLQKIMNAVMRQKGVLSVERIKDKSAFKLPSGKKTGK
ncbi:MAG: RelA/SpoT family protein [Candidatus Nitrospinota bacterium M3_3B_026]